MRIIGSLALIAALSSCVGGVQPPQPYPRPSRGGAPARIVPATPLAPVSAPVMAGGITAATVGVVAGPPIETLPLTEAQAEAARIAFLSTCPALLRRTDASGLTTMTDWAPACDAARSSGAGGARAFFSRYFETAQIGDGRAFATGYYEPEIAGSRDRRPGYDTPVYARPSDLIEVDLGAFSTDYKGKKIRGRVDRQTLVPYFDRTQIEDGALADRARVIAWAADPVEMFFLQIQGSGRLRLPDGSVMRIGYDTQNGRDYTGIGTLMRQRGLLAPGQTSMQGIVAWLHAHPDEGRALMRENRSFVFFRELTTPPVGALGYPVTPQVTVAADTKFMPLGAPVFLSMDRADATGLWVAQDTGGAIKGANRFDTFWGAGDAARATAGGMAARGTAFLLLPVGTIAKRWAGGVGGGPTPRP